MDLNDYFASHLGPTPYIYSLAVLEVITYPPVPQHINVSPTGDNGYSIKLPPTFTPAPMLRLTAVGWDVAPRVANGLTTAIHHSAEISLYPSTGVDCYKANLMRAALQEWLDAKRAELTRPSDV